MAWRALQAQLDAAVDAQFGELVRLVPMRAASAYSPRLVDPTRQAVEVMAKFQTLDDRAMNMTADRSGQQFRSRAALGSIRIHVQTELIAAFNITEGDVVVMLERDGERYEVSRFNHDATLTTMIDLVRSDR